MDNVHTLRLGLLRRAFELSRILHSSDQKPSHVLLAIGLDNAMARSSIRVGFGRFTTMEEVDEAAEQITAAALRLQRI